MIEVEGPGGVVIEFPDGTAREVMQSAMQKHFAPTARTGANGGGVLSELGKAINPLEIGREISRTAGEGIEKIKARINTPRSTEGPIEGLMTTGGAILGAGETLFSPITGTARNVGGHVMTALEHGAGQIIAPEIAAKDDLQKMYEASRGDVDKAAMAARPAGMPIRTPAIPQGPAPTTALGGPRYPNAPGGAIAHDPVFELPQSQGAYGWAQPPQAPPAPPAAPVPLTEGQEVTAAANRLSATGEPVQVPKAVATDSTAIQRIAATARNVPLAGDPLVKSAERTLGQLGTKADEVAAGYGGGTVEGSGEAAGTAIKNWITGESKATSDKLYNRVDSLVDPQATTPLVNTRNIVADIRAENAAAFQPEGKAVGILSEAAEADGLTYQGIKTLRTKIGEAMDSGILPEGLSGGELKRLYGALTDDLRSSVLTGGSPKAVAEFDRANNYYKLVSDRREALAKIVGKDGNVPAEKVFDSLRAMATSTGRADHVKLAQARKAIGADDWNEFASGVAAKLGRDVEGNFSPARFITDYEKLSEAGKNILFRSGGKGDLAQHLDDIAKVSSRFKELQKFANPSGTSQSVGGMSIGAGLLTAPMTTIGTVLGARTLSYALSRPATAASVAKVVRAHAALAANPSPTRLAAYAMASRNLVSTLGDKAQGIAATDFMRALQGPVQGRAQDEQR